MKRVLQGLSLLLSLILTSHVNAQEFKDLTQDQKFESYFESCEKEQFANCYQVAHWYIENKRLDPIEERTIRDTIRNLQAEKAKALEENKDFPDESQTELNTLAAKLVPENQEKISAVKGKEFLLLNLPFYLISKITDYFQWMLKQNI